MNFEKEITVLVLSSYDELHKKLLEYNFEIKEEYIINDIYMIDKNIGLKNMNNLDILKKCILVRDIVEIEKLLLYKYKEYNENGDILKQGKVKCKIDNIYDAVNFMKSINYKELFKIFDKNVVYSNEKTELVVQIVNDEYIFIEMEDKCQYINKEYKNIEEMIDDLNSYNLPIDKNSYFVKKAELMLSKIDT